MSPQPLSRSADLLRLRNEGYEVSVRAGYLVVSHVPYVTPAGTVEFGTLVSTLNYAGGATAQPETHTINFAGSTPSDEHGRPLSALIHSPQIDQVVPGVTTQFLFSSKPRSGQYTDYHAKVTTYVAILEQHAQAIDPTVTARTFAPSVDDDEESVFVYADTASTRAGIQVIQAKLAIGRVAVVGLGGTGAYTFDLLAKTPIQELHLFDGDRFHQHNAFRSPGAATLAKLRGEPVQGRLPRGPVQDLAPRHRRAPRAIIFRQPAPSSTPCSSSSWPLTMAAKRHIVTHLEQQGIAFADVGMGLYAPEDQVGGIVRTTLSKNSPTSRAAARAQISFADDTGNEYATNIQIADLNVAERRPCRDRVQEVGRVLPRPHPRRHGGLHRRHRHLHRGVQHMSITTFRPTFVEEIPERPRRRRPLHLDPLRSDRAPLRIGMRPRDRQSALARPVVHHLQRRRRQPLPLHRQLETPLPFPLLDPSRTSGMGLWMDLRPDRRGTEERPGSARPALHACTPRRAAPPSESASPAPV